MSFRLVKRSRKSRARLGVLVTAHGNIPTPCFMPIATKAAVKSITSEELRTVGADAVLANTYHLWLRPGLSVIKKAGGLHRFMRWDGPILTDSGGYQVFSLANYRKLSEHGVEFRDPLDGKLYHLTPEESIRIQRTLGSDIIMVLDECPPYPVAKRYAQDSLKLTTRWAERCLRAPRATTSLLFGIVQGSVFPDLRREHARELAALPFDGYALGGLAVGEPEQLMYKMIEVTEPELPTNKPRYVMGIGKPHQLVEAVRRGMDMFDCVLPTRDARHGRLYVWTPKGRSTFLRSKAFYRTVGIKNASLARAFQPLDPACPCLLCTEYSPAFLRHCCMTNEPLALRLATLHNLTFYLELFGEMRGAIRNGAL